MKVTKNSSKLIKPHIPTPPNLNYYYLSFLDKCMGPENFTVILYYESTPKNTNNLEESLAKTLVRFYPLAGRYNNNDHFIDCSDQGAMFVEAEAQDTELMDLIAEPEAEQLNALLPNPCLRTDAPNPLLSIQATHFPSSGVAIAIVVSHIVMDGSSLGTFISAWSNATNPDGKIGFTPSFDLHSLLPYKDHDFGIHLIPEARNFVSKRFFFDRTVIRSLKSKLRSVSKAKRISRMRVVCAVIAKAMIAVDGARRGKTRDFVIALATNLRERVSPSQPKHACGNLVVPSLTPRVAASGIEIHKLVDLIDDSIGKCIADHAELLSPHRDGRDIIINSYGRLKQALGDPDTNTLAFSDWTKFGFYKADFGWGKPVWTSIGPAPQLMRTTYLMTDKDDVGIEAWVHLDQDDMHYFEQNEEIKTLTTRGERDTMMERR